MQRRGLNPFSLSFLDVMACGLGAVVLLFMIINHAAQQRSERSNLSLNTEIERLERQLLHSKNALDTLNDARRATESQLIEIEDENRQISASIQNRTSELAQIRDMAREKRTRLSALQNELKTTQETVDRLQDSQADTLRQEEATRTFIGQGDRQYLTGLKMGGKRILILVDASASMLDETIVNVIRQRNLPEKQRVRAPKWQKVTATVDWITTQIPASSRFQIYTFNVDTKPVIPGSDAKWLSVAQGQLLDQAVEKLRNIAPEQGTSLYKAFAVVTKLKPRPDNIYLLTDGLPTQGKKKSSNKTVSAEQRIDLFRQSLDILPSGIPINTILFPLEGDPRAASAYWQLAQSSSGSFLTPSADWP